MENRKILRDLKNYFSKIEKKYLRVDLENPWIRQNTRTLLDALWLFLDCQYTYDRHMASIYERPILIEPQFLCYLISYERRALVALRYLQRYCPLRSIFEKFEKSKNRRKIKNRALRKASEPKSPMSALPPPTWSSSSSTKQVCVASSHLSPNFVTCLSDGVLTFWGQKINWITFKTSYLVPRKLRKLESGRLTVVN